MPMAFKLGMTIDAHAHFDDLDLNARSQWVDKGKKSAWNYFNN